MKAQDYIILGVVGVLAWRKFKNEICRLFPPICGKSGGSSWQGNWTNQAIKKYENYDYKDEPDIRNDGSFGVGESCESKILRQKGCSTTTGGWRDWFMNAKCFFYTIPFSDYRAQIKECTRKRLAKKPDSWVKQQAPIASNGPPIPTYRE